jgi:hypothetical protein
MNRRSFGLAATASTRPFFTPPARPKRIAQVARIGWVYPESRALNVFDTLNVDLGRKNISEHHQSIERIDQLGRAHIPDVLHQHFAVYGGAGETESLENRNFAAIEINFALHRKLFAGKALLSSVGSADVTGAVATRCP